MFGSDHGNALSASSKKNQLSCAGFWITCQLQCVEQETMLYFQDMIVVFMLDSRPW
jgi:hypothetical protein